MVRMLGAMIGALLAGTYLGEPATAMDWPKQTLTMVVPFAAGGGTDVMGRIMARRMSEILGQPVIVENVPGGGGRVGFTRVIRAAPDGYTFVFGGRSDAIAMTLYKRPPYSLRDDAEPIALVGYQPTILVARKDLPVDGLQNFIAYLKQNAATIKMGAAGLGATGSIDCAIFNSMIGVNVPPIPYRGSGPAMQDLITGQFDHFCTISGSAVAPLQSGLVKGIAVFDRERMASLPNLPTANEQGFNFEASSWWGFFAPKGTPREIIKKLSEASVAAMETPEVQNQLAKNGIYVVPPEQRSAEYFRSFLGPEIEKNGAPLKSAGVSID
ncbi:MAG: tripartite tricarboxylate transporter substrate-binding protein [Pseudomonadota bacterium]